MFYIYIGRKVVGVCGGEWGREGLPARPIIQFWHQMCRPLLSPPISPSFPLSSPPTPSSQHIYINFPPYQYHILHHSRCSPPSSGDDIAHSLLRGDRETTQRLKSPHAHAPLRAPVPRSWYCYTPIPTLHNCLLNPFACQHHTLLLVQSSPSHAPCGG